MSKKHYFIIILIIALLGITKLLGTKLDKKAELLTSKTFTTDKNGIIEGADSIVHQNGKQQAIIFVHGFASTPKVFAELIDDIKDESNSDIYAPLLPYNGRDLQTLTITNNQVVLDYLEQIITQFSKIYKKITIVGLSYGGAQLAKLVSENKIPDNSIIILYAPALHLYSNDFWQRNFAKLYSVWREYCDYEILGCQYPNYESADAKAKPIFTTQKDFHYLDIPALVTMFNFDLSNRNSIKNIQRPFSILIAKDDNLVSYNKIKEDCAANAKFCKLHAFSSGKHIIHWGEKKLKFEKLILKLSRERP